MIRAEIEKLKSQEQNDHQNNNLHDIIEKTIEEEVKKKHIEDRATAILMNEIRQIGGGHSMMMSVESKQEQASSCSGEAEATELDDDLSQSQVDDIKWMRMRNIPSTMSKLSTNPMDDEDDIFDMLVIPPAPLLPSRPIPKTSTITTNTPNSKNIDNNNSWTSKHATGSNSIASVETFDSRNNRTIPASVPFISNSVHVNTITGPTAFRAVPPPMPPPDDTDDYPFDSPLPPAPAVPSR